MHTSDIHSLRVLVAEDRYLVAQMHAQMLAGHGCCIVGPVASVERALELLKSEHVDLGLLDVDLGGTPCVPIADELLRRGVGVVVLTGFNTEQIPARYRQLPLLEKPVDPARLAAALDDARHQAAGA
jgi:CheY-like chemotaxis protein